MVYLLIYLLLLQNKPIMHQTLKALLFIALIALTGCNEYKDRPVAVKEIEGFDFGHVRNNTYTNTFFNIKMDVPNGWLVQDEKQKEELMKHGREASLSNDQKKNVAIKASEITTANLFTAFCREPGTVAFNHSLIIIAENIGQYSMNITPEIYLENANKMLRSSQMEIIQIDNSFRKKELNGMEYYEMGLVNFVENMNVRQTYLITIDKGFVFGFIYSYTDDEQKKELEKAIYSLRPLKKSTDS